MISQPNAGLLIVGHGSTVNADSSAPTLASAAEIRRRSVFAEVACCFWKEEPSMRDALLFFPDRSAIEEVYVVPNFISEGYFTETVIPRELELSGLTTERGSGQLWKYCQPVGNNPGVTDLLLQRAREIAPQVPEDEATLLIVGHGTALNDNSAVAAKREVEKIGAMRRYAAVHNAYMEEPPLVADWLKLTSTRNVIVVPFFIADGLHSYEDIPVLLGIETQAIAGPNERRRSGDVFRHNPYEIAGRRLFYAGAIGTEPRFADLLVEQAATFERQNSHLRSLT